MSMRIHRPIRAAWLAAAAVAGAVLATGAAAPTFFDDDPIWREPQSQDASKATRYEPDLTYQTLDGLFNPGPPGGQRARNINTVDEVPDGAFYENRSQRIALTPALVARAANTSEGPAPGPWTVISAKSDGITPGFTIRDSAKAVWFIKFDPPGYANMATGSEVVAAKLFWAVGYHTVEYHIGHLVPSNLVVGEGARITPAGEAQRAMEPADIGRLLTRAERSPDGSYRVILSKAAPGKPVGRIVFEGTRADDPNDIVPHEHRRELRGYRMFAAWLNHVDAKGINSLSVLMPVQGGRSIIRHYLLDFGSALGSAAIGPREGWEGSEELVERPGEIGRRIISFGLRVPSWRIERFYESPSVGRLPTSSDKWDPLEWAPHIMNRAFRYMRADDAFWAADKLMPITDAIIDAAVAEGQFGDPPSERELARVIRQRRDRIFATAFTRVNPIARPSLGPDGLRFENAAVQTGVSAPPGGYAAAWSRFDNATGTATPVAETSATASPLPVPPAISDFSEGSYVQVTVRATRAPHPEWERPVTLHFRKTGGSWRLVGLERLP
jgi:hypothetical protein